MHYGEGVEWPLHVLCVCCCSGFRNVHFTLNTSRAQFDFWMPVHTSNRMEWKWFWLAAVAVPKWISTCVIKLAHMTPSHKFHRKSRIKLISNGVRCRKRLTNPLFFHRCDLRSSWFGIDEHFYPCASRVATINQICTRRFTLNKVSICSYYTLHLSLVFVLRTLASTFFSFFLSSFLNLVSWEPRDDYMLWLNLYLFLCLEACKAIIYRTCDFVHANGGCGVHNRNEYFHEIEIFLFHFHKSNDRTHTHTNTHSHMRLCTANESTSRNCATKPTIPRAKWNTIGCLSSNERMLVAETRLFCFPLLFFFASSLFVFHLPHRISAGRSDACIRRNANRLLHRRKFSYWMTIYGRSHASKYIRRQWHKTDRFQLFTIYRSFVCSAAAAAAVNVNRHRSLDSVWVLILCYCHRPRRPFNCISSVRKQAIMDLLKRMREWAREHPNRTSSAE